MNPWFEADHIVDDDLYKYIRMSDGSLRFINVDWDNDHRSLLSINELAHKDQLVVSAGTIGVRGNRYKVTAYGSTSLGIKFDGDDEKFLTIALGKVYDNGI